MGFEQRSGARRFAVGVDCGGTFTDVALIEQNSGDLWIAKTSSTPDDPSRAFIDGVLKAMALAGATPNEIRQVFHATTVATNAILEGRGAVAAMLTTTGFRHVLEIGRHDIPRNANMFGWIKPKRPVPPELIYEVEGRIDSEGVEDTPLDESAVRRAAASLHSNTKTH